MQKTNQKKKKKKKRIKEVIRRKADKLYFKWKGDDNSFNSCTDKKIYIKLIIFQNLPIVKTKEKFN